MGHARSHCEFRNRRTWFSNESLTNRRDHSNFKLDHCSVKVITASNRFSQRHNVVFYRDACALDSLIAVSLSIAAAWAEASDHSARSSRERSFWLAEMNPSQATDWITSISSRFPMSLNQPHQRFESLHELNFLNFQKLELIDNCKFHANCRHTYHTYDTRLLPQTNWPS
jgi:hypothetical protein